ncbi:hypothetical protein HAX54_017862, partial [Datura stramonium]|nr:hypothetical protein [Datura stramonium]
HRRFAGVDVRIFGWSQLLAVNTSALPDGTGGSSMLIYGPLVSNFLLESRQLRSIWRLAGVLRRSTDH